MRYAILALLLTLLPAAARAQLPGDVTPMADDADDSAMAAAPTVDDAFAEAGAGTIDLRLLVRTRYTWTRIDEDSVAQIGSDYGARGKLQADEIERMGWQERATAQDDDGWRIERAFVRMLARGGNTVQGRVMLDVAEFAHKPARAMKLAHVEWKPWKRVSLTAGCFKRRLSLLELLPAAEWEVADDGAIGVLLKDQGWTGRDLGAMVRVQPLAKKRWLALELMASAGDVDDGVAARPLQLLTARAESEPWRGRLRLGLSGAARLWPVQEYGATKGVAPFDVVGTGWATEADVTLRLGGFEARAEAVTGVRTDLAIQKAYQEGRRFMGLWSLLAWRGSVFGRGVIPAVRWETLDCDTLAPAQGTRYTATAALTVELGPGTRLLLDASKRGVQPGTRALDDVPGATNGTRVHDLDSWRFVAQVQAVL